MSKKLFLINIIAFVVAVLLLPFMLAFGCQTGCTEYEGNCACDQPAEKAPDVQAASDEKPPQDKMPSYEREGIHADMPPSTAAQDAKADQERNQADQDGKKAAGI